MSTLREKMKLRNAQMRKRKETTLAKEDVMTDLMVTNDNQEQTMSSLDLRTMVNEARNGAGEIRQTEDGYTQSLFTMKGEAWVIEQLTYEGII